MTTETKPHVLHVGFVEAFAASTDFVGCHVTAVLDSGAAASMPPGLRHRFAEVLSFDTRPGIDLNGYDRELDTIHDLALRLGERFGPPSAVVGMFEHTAIAAGHVRDMFGVRGTSEEAARRCRDKVLMKDAVAAAGIDVPRYRPVDSDTPPGEIAAIARELRGRLILKPRSQAASLGVVELADGDALLAHAAEHRIEDGYQVEEFVEGAVCHFDGVIRDGVLRFFSASRYLTTCFEFQHHRTPLASVTIGDEALVARARRLAEEVLAAVGVTDSSFHLEAFHTADDRLVFLEIAARFGGAGIVAHVKNACGVDLVEESFLACTGEPSRIPEPAPTVPPSGWLLMAVPAAGRCVVRGMSGLDPAPEHVIHSDVPNLAQVLDASAGVFVAAGRFTFAGPSHDAVERSVRHVMDTFRVTVEEAPAPE